MSRDQSHDGLGSSESGMGAGDAKRGNNAALGGRADPSSVRRFFLHPAYIFALQIIAVIGFAIGINQQITDHTFSRCLASYNNAYAATAQQRLDATTETTAAIDQFIAAVIAATKIPDQQQQAAAGQKALDTYQAERAQANKLRADNPLPEPPKERC